MSPYYLKQKTFYDKYAQKSILGCLLMTTKWPKHKIIKKNVNYLESSHKDLKNST